MKNRVGKLPFYLKFLMRTEWRNISCQVIQVSSGEIHLCHDTRYQTRASIPKMGLTLKRGSEVKWLEQFLSRPTTYSVAQSCS